jgi:hypothetical protein
MSQKNELAEMANAAAPAGITDLVRSEIDIQITTAKRFPRSIEAFRQQALSMATLDAATAASCFYKLKRKGKDGETVYIEGPSVRLAEIVASAWHNLRFGARIIAEDNRFVTAQGMAFDLENNVCNVIEVARRITDKNGRRYSDDMVGVTKNAACAIALRNAIFKTVPFTYAKQVYEQAKKTAVGDVKTLGERRQQMVEAFGKISVTTEQILDYCEKKAMADIGLADIEDLLGVFSAIKDGDTSVEEVFRKASAAAPIPEQTNELTARQKFEVAKAKLFAAKGKVAVEAIQATMSKDITDYSDAELSELTAKLTEAAK